MIKVVILGSWAPYVGADYCDALGVYDDIEEAWPDASDYAWDRWEPGEMDEDGFEDEGPYYTVEEYNPEQHDMLRAGGGSFQDDFDRLLE